MVYIVAITSQGQISIPAKIRKQLGLFRTSSAQVSVSDGKMIVEPVRDLLSLAGSMKTKKKLQSQKIRQEFEHFLADEATHSQK